MSNFLYTILVYPLSQIIEVVYRVFFEVFKNEGISVIGVSMAVTLLCLPLYAVAENWQQIERDTQLRLKDGIKRIKETFKGDEQYMILNTFYRENHYHPMYALRASFGLLIQIPFFIAAYSFLSNNQDLLGKSFLFIKDMGKPDAIYTINKFSINIFPIAMTLINIIAGAIYTKGFAIKEKLQIYGMALIFLVVLYDSPSGLVIYWTMNNVFSLVKNIFYKLKKPLKVFWIMLSTIFAFASIFVMMKMDAFQSLPVIAIALLVIFFPFIFKGINYVIENFLKDFTDNSKKRNYIFITSALSLALLIGFVIPSFLITSSTASDFAYIDSYTTPLYFVFNSTLQALGLFFIWPIAVYFLFGRKVQSFLSFTFLCLLIISLVNAFCFQGNYGIISADLIFIEHKSFKPSFLTFVSNTLSMILVIATLLIITKKNSNIAKNTISNILLLSIGAISILNGVKIQSSFKTVSKPAATLDSIEPAMKLSKTNKNVLVIMLDRAPGFYIDDVMIQNPQLNEQLTGFIFYPNTASLGSWTIQGCPGLYGGYEYGPWEMNQRREITMQEKHNQSLSLLSEMFSREGFDSYLIDPPYPNYDTEPVFSFLDGKENITPKNLCGKYTDIWFNENNMEKLPVKSNRIKRNFLWFGIFKSVPPILRSAVHFNDWWASPTQKKSIIDYIDKYSVLEYLPRLTDTACDKPCFIFIDNETTHDSAIVQAPDFVPVEGNIDLSPIKNKEFKDNACYHAVNASLLKLGQWFDYLKKQGVYDNTRIIISSDHGLNSKTSKFQHTGNIDKNLEWFNPCLLVKDYNAEWNGLKTDNSFMTNADVPAIAVNEVLKNNKNPFTEKEIKILTQDEKLSKTIISFSKANAVRSTKNNEFNIQDTDWYTCNGNIFSTENWKQLKVKNDRIIK